MARPTTFYRVNAPAGSGKTYYISQTINTIAKSSPYANILCITYTNRAAKVMRDRIISPNVSIATIHSFFNNFLQPFFSNKAVIDYYTEFYREEIENTLTRLDLVERYKENMRIDGELTVEIVADNLNHIYYNERKNSFVLDGGLSHDDLLEFAFKLIEKFPKIGLKLREMYQYIFIDEVQDTSADILKFFHNATKDSSTEVYFLGDKMQEIYDKYDGSFEEAFDSCDNSISEQFNVNYRSSDEIVCVLNNLYLSNSKTSQYSNKGAIEIIPKLILTDNIEGYLSNHIEDYREFYKLRTVNIKRFENINNSGKSAAEIYKLFQKIYPSTGRISVMDVLGNNKFEENPDELMSFLSLLFQIVGEFTQKNYGEVIRLLKISKKKLPYGKLVSIFDDSLLKIEYHKDKVRLKEKIGNVISLFNSDKMLGVIIQELMKNKILSKGFYEFIFLYEKNERFLYTELFCQPIELFKLIDDYNRNPMVSTQHGVKGEGHKKILFVAEDSSNPGIKMYDFLNLFVTFQHTNNNFSLDDFQKFYYEFNKDISVLEEIIDKKIKEVKKIDREQHFLKFKEIYDKYQNDEYFKFICLKNNTLNFQKNSTLKDMKIIFNNNLVRNTLTAYKLFYVGCSRAEEELAVLIDENKIDDLQQFSAVFQSLGFRI